MCYLFVHFFFANQPKMDKEEIMADGSGSDSLSQVCECKAKTSTMYKT